MAPLTSTMLKRSLKLGQMRILTKEANRSPEGLNSSRSRRPNLIYSSRFSPRPNLLSQASRLYSNSTQYPAESNSEDDSSLYSNSTQNSTLYSTQNSNLIQDSNSYSNPTRISVRNSSESLENSLDNSENQIILNYLDGKDNGIAVLCLNRPALRNALGKTILSQLKTALNSIHADSKLRVLIIRSLVPKVFCAGADLRERSRMTAEEAEEFVGELRATIDAIEKLATPVISAIDGAAIGGGLEIALASDVRVASKGAKMGLVETKLAIIPGAGGTQRLPRIVGPAKAKELIFTGRIVEGEEAEKIGIVNKSVEENKNGDAAYEEALGIAREILGNGPIGVQMAKAAISRGLQTDMENGLEIEEECYNKVIHTKDRIEGLAAFAAKRRPVYKGI